jgi:signal transduction histidine kinase
VAIEDFERLTPSEAAYRRFRCYTAPVRRREGATIGRILVLRDVTRESEAERMRTALVSNVSHELRSPLTSIKGYVETLIQGGPWEPELEHEFLEIIAGAADKLGGLVDNLLDAAKMDAGMLSVEYEPVRVERIAAAIVSRAQPLTTQHELRIEAESGLPLVSADPMRVEQVITNLLENAIKYSPPGEPIAVQVRGGAMLTVSVTDHGVGIAPEDAAHLFERFYRADTRFTRATPGVGLGLHICKGLVEAHGGHIWVESAGAGQGSTFSFTLPALVEPASVGRAA